VRGAILAGWRLLRCNPWSHGGVDYARDQTVFPAASSKRVGT
jgi:putative component of membrane protein insertase Oxa1/YidC/SpoIIIJ protein YidD